MSLAISVPGLSFKSLASADKSLSVGMLPLRSLGFGRDRRSPFSLLHVSLSS